MAIDQQRNARNIYSNYLFAQTEVAGLHPSIVVADAGPMHMLTHMAHTGFPRQPFIARGEMNRVGGKLTHWGVSTPRPAEEMLLLWPYEIEKLSGYFDAVEQEMHVNDAIPKSDGALQDELLTRLRHHFPHYSLRPAPLAIDRDGRRWCPLAQVPVLVKKGLRILARFRVTELIASNERIVEVHGQWLDGKTWALRPQFVVLGVGVEESLPLIR